MSDKFDLGTQAGMTHLLSSVRASEITPREKNELRDIILSYISGGMDTSVRLELERKINTYDIKPLATTLGRRPAIVRQNLEAVGPYGNYRATPSFGLVPEGSVVMIPKKETVSKNIPIDNEKQDKDDDKSTIDTTEQLNQEIRTPHSNDKPKAIFGVGSEVVSSDRSGKVEAGVEKPESESRNEEVTPRDFVSGSKYATTSATQANDNPLQRIREIKSEVNALVGNPVKLVEIDNKIGREYMTALLEAMKAINSGTSAIPYMDRLEKSFEIVKQIVPAKLVVADPAPIRTAINHPSVTPLDTNVENLSKTTDSTAVVSPNLATVGDLTKASIPSPNNNFSNETGPLGDNPVPGPTLPADNQSESTLSQGKAEEIEKEIRPLSPDRRSETYSLNDSETFSPQEAVNTTPAEPAEVGWGDNPVPTLKNTGFVQVPVRKSVTAENQPLSGFEKTYNTSESESPNPETAPMPPRLNKDDEYTLRIKPDVLPQNDALLSSVAIPVADTGSPVTPALATSVAKLDVRLKTLESLRPDPVTTGAVDPLQTPDVTEGLSQLLSEWQIFKRSGIFGTGPGGIEHPLYKKLSSLQIPLILAGRFEGSTQEIRQSVTDYMNGWRYEQGIVYEQGETFEHYLRRVIRCIIDLQDDLQKKQQGG